MKVWVAKFMHDRNGDMSDEMEADRDKRFRAATSKNKLDEKLRTDAEGTWWVDFVEVGEKGEAIKLDLLCNILERRGYITKMLKQYEVTVDKKDKRLIRWRQRG